MIVNTVSEKENLRHKSIASADEDSKQGQIHGYLSRVQVSSSGDKTSLSYILAGVVMQKPRINA